MMQLNLSARAYQRMRSVKLASTSADLVGCKEFQSVHLAKALHADFYSPGSTEFCQEIFDEGQVMGEIQQKNIWIFVYATGMVGTKSNTLFKDKRE
jgi:magnesium chelatase subunit ChlI-like protein